MRFLLSPLLLPVLSALPPLSALPVVFFGGGAAFGLIGITLGGGAAVGWVVLGAAGLAAIPAARPWLRDRARRLQES